MARSRCLIPIYRRSGDAPIGAVQSSGEVSGWVMAPCSVRSSSIHFLEIPFARADEAESRTENAADRAVP